MKKILVLFVLLVGTIVNADEKTPIVSPPKDKAAVQNKWGRGYVAPTKAVLDARHDEAKKRHGNRMAFLPKATPATFDCTALGWAAPVGDQGQCGSCWLYSVVVNVSSAYMKAGYGATWAFSPQYAMDCLSPNDPCQGGDEYDMFVLAKSGGFVTEADYGIPYAASQGSCRYKSQKKSPIADWIYCDPAQASGQTSTQAIKNAMVQYGMVSIALDASQFNNYTTGVITISTQNIDHAVNIVGWDDAKAAFKIQNQWGTGWGMNGFIWVSYNSYLVEGMV